METDCPLPARHQPDCTPPTPPFPLTQQPQVTGYELRGDSIGPNDSPLITGQYLSAATTNTANNDFRSALSLPDLDASDDSSTGVCLWATDRGSVRITRGNEPPVSRSLIPLWEVGGKADKVDKNKRSDGGKFKASKGGMRWLTATLDKVKDCVNRATSNDGGAAMRTSSPKVSHPSPDNRSLLVGEGSNPVHIKDTVTASAGVNKGRITVKTHTTAYTDSGEAKTTTKVTFKSKRPKGWWKAYVAFLSEEGRQIRDSALRVLPDGRVTTMTPGGRVLWEALPGDDDRSMDRRKRDSLGHSFISAALGDSL